MTNLLKHSSAIASLNISNESAERNSLGDLNMAKGIVERMIRVLGDKLFLHKPKTPYDMKYYLKYGPERWHQKAYPHKYTRSTGAQ